MLRSTEQHLRILFCCLGMLFVVADGHAREMLLPVRASITAEHATCDGTCCEGETCSASEDAACPVTGETCTCSRSDDEQGPTLPAAIAPQQQPPVFILDAAAGLSLRSTGRAASFQRIASLPRFHKVRLHLLNRSILC